MRVTEILSQFDPSGLSPRDGIWIDETVPRESVKEFFLSQGYSLAQNALFTSVNLARWILGARVKTGRILSSHALEEFLVFVLKQKGASEHYPELRKGLKTLNFSSQLQQTVAAMRESFATDQQRDVLLQESAKLNAQGDSAQISPRKLELIRLGLVLDTWLEQNDLYDDVRILREAIEALYSSTSHYIFPERILFFSVKRMEALESLFMDEVARRVKLIKLQDFEPKFFESQKIKIESKVGFARLHTLDSAADRVAQIANQQLDDSFGVVLPDDPKIRRSLMLALKRHGVVLEDTRDPTAVLNSDTLKKAFLPFQVIRKNFARAEVFALLESDWVKLSYSDRLVVKEKLNELGFRQGEFQLRSQPIFQALWQPLEPWKKMLTKRWRIADLKSQNLRMIQEIELTWQDLEIIEGVWNQLETDMNHVYGAQAYYPGLFWFDRMFKRVFKSPPIPSKNLNRGGLQTYRLGVLPVRIPKKLVFFLPPLRWMQSPITGTDWLNVRERERLAEALEMRGSLQEQREKRWQLATWFQEAEEVILIEAQYDFDGGALESVKNALSEWFEWTNWTQLEFGKTTYQISLEKSLGAPRWIEPVTITIPEGLRISSISVSQLSDFARCSFQGLLSKFWKVDENEQPDLDLPKHVEGRWIHKLVEKLSHLAINSGFANPKLHDKVFLTDLAKREWQQLARKNVFESEPLFKAALHTVVERILLWTQKEKELEDLKQPFKILSLEGSSLDRDFFYLGTIKVKGRPDRIDRIGDLGHYVLDYKTGAAPDNSQLKSGVESQLVLYKKIVEESDGIQVVAAGYIEIGSDKITQSKGLHRKDIFGGFKKRPENLSRTKLENESEFRAIEDAVMSHLDQTLQDLKTGSIRIHPKYPTERDNQKLCGRCRHSDVCLRKRYRELETEHSSGPSGPTAEEN